MNFLSPSGFSDYELIDCGDFQKLERFGKFLTIRPEPQALWKPEMPMSRWEKQAHVKFIPKSSSSGTWKKLKEMPDRWQVQYLLKDQDFSKSIHFRLGLTSFKHVGIFPEQAVNWGYIFRAVRTLKSRQKEVKVLNLFAYTGGASLAAAAAGATVFHLDSIRQVVNWANDNMKLSGISDIRWIVEDALKFANRELKRGHRYQGIIMDPPAFGHGPNGEKWKLEDQIFELVESTLGILSKENSFLILNAYSLGLSSLVIENLLKNFAGKKLETGELFLPSSSGQKLPLGVFGRFLMT
jgi:23S rRNA (cytosine1962-C5)-methyltransferase